MSATTITTLNYQPELRLTRRGRIVLLVAALLVLLVCGVAMAAGSGATTEIGKPAPTDTVVVGSGDTMWDIASARAGDGDTQAMIDKILDLNHLDSVALMPGEQLVVPAG